MHSKGCLNQLNISFIRWQNALYLTRTWKLNAVNIWNCSDRKMWGQDSRLRRFSLWRLSSKLRFSSIQYFDNEHANQRKQVNIELVDMWNSDRWWWNYQKLKLLEGFCPSLSQRHSAIFCEQLQMLQRKNFEKEKEDSKTCKWSSRIPCCTL